MKPFSGYDEVRANNFDGESIKVGGHYCKILDVKTETYVNKETKKPFQQLILKIDICEPDEQAGFYQRKFEKSALENAMEAKWKGFYKITIPEDDSEDRVKSNFKTLTTSVEKSNPGYKWTWDEKTLIGKTFGGVFGLEEFEIPNDGKVITFCRCRFIRSTEKISEVGIPKVKLLDGSYKDYEEYIEERKQGNHGDSYEGPTESKNEESKITDSDELPF